MATETGLTLDPQTREIVTEMLGSDRYKRAWPAPGNLLRVGAVKLSVQTFYTATRMVRTGQTPRPAAGGPMWTAWSVAITLNQREGVVAGHDH